MTAMIDATFDRIVELDERESNGIRVTLVWNRETDSLCVLVRDERTEESLTIEVRAEDDAYDVFNHPFAYAALRGTSAGKTPVECSCA